MDEDELNDRMSRRFGSDDDEAESSEQDMSPSTSQTSNNEQKSSKTQTKKKAQKAQKAQNIKKEWNVRSFYLDDGLDSELTTAFKRLDLELSESGAELDLKKTRHFYPLVVELGLERLEEMESTEVTERLEGEDSV